MIPRPLHFKAYELCDPATYEIYGEQALQFFRPEALQMLDQLSAFFQVPILINNWKSGGPFQWRGLRTIECTQGSARGAHRLGAGWDFNVQGKTPQEVYDTILANPDEFPAIKRMENIEKTPTWTHCDTIEFDGGGILIVEPA